MKRAFWIGLFTVVIGLGVIVAFFIYSPVSNQRWGLTNWSDRFPSHDGFTRLAVMIRHTTCERLLSTPAEKERRAVFTWRQDEPWSPESKIWRRNAPWPPDSTISKWLPTEQLALPVNQTLHELAGMSVADTFVAVTHDSINYVLYARRLDQPADSVLSVAVMVPLDFFMSYFEAKVHIMESTTLGRSWSGWVGSGEVTMRLFEHVDRYGEFGGDSTFRPQGAVDTVRIAYGDVATFELIGVESPVIRLWGMASGKR
jgi:hypothetical protein